MYVLIMAIDKPFREFITSNEASRHESKTQASIQDFRHVGTQRPWVFNYECVYSVMCVFRCITYVRI